MAVVRGSRGTESTGAVRCLAMRTPRDKLEATAPPARESFVSPWPAALAVTVFALSCIAVSQFIVHFDDAVLDDHLFTYYGWCIAEGATLYRDIWDHKPPGTFWLNGLAYLGGRGEYACVFVLTLLAQVTAVAFFAMAASMHFQRSSAIVLSAMAAVFLTHSHFFGGSNRGETYLIALDLMLLTCYLLGRRRDRTGWWICVGACGGAAMLMKQTGGAAMLAVVLHLLLTCISSRTKRLYLTRRLLLIAAGAVSLLALAALVLLAQGTLAEAWRAIFTVNQAYLAIETAGPADSRWWWLRLERSGWPLLKLPLLLATGSILHACATISRHSNAHATPDDAAQAQADFNAILLLTIWLIVSLAAAMAGPMPSTHYMLPVLPPLLLLGGRLLDRLLGEAALLDQVARRASVLVALLFIAYLAAGAIATQAQKASVVYWERKPAWENGRLRVEPSDAERLGRTIAEQTQPDEALLCWDYLPAVMLESKRRNASRFPSYLHFKIARQAGICRVSEFLEAIESGAAAVIVLKSETRRQIEAAARDVTSEVHAEARAVFSRYEHRPEWTRGGMDLLTRVGTIKP